MLVTGVRWERVWQGGEAAWLPISATVTGSERVANSHGVPQHLSVSRSVTCDKGT